MFFRCNWPSSIVCRKCASTKYDLNKEEKNFHFGCNFVDDIVRFVFWFVTIKWLSDAIISDMYVCVLL